jgi:hypothetical protein
VEPDADASSGCGEQVNAASTMTMNPIWPLPAV